ncbi:MAG: DUF624 domain-containing protein [Erysipelotrichaceae bacterium]|nr:DUF624 domain-containing protein [Erysipelotrichaceae bacterium]
MKILETIANMLIVSFFWIVCSIPIVTIIPASVALYHTSNKIIFNGRGQGVMKDFFNTFKDNILIGVKINLIYLIATFFVFVGDYAAIQIYKWNIFGLLYLILAIIVTLVYAVSLIYIPAVISRFYLKIIDTIRLSLFFAFQNIFISILNVILLAFIVLMIEVVPLVLVIAPALYVDLTRIGIEKKMQKFIEDNNLQDNLKPVEEENDKQEEISSTDINSRLARKKSK